MDPPAACSHATAVPIVPKESSEGREEGRRAGEQSSRIDGVTPLMLKRNTGGNKKTSSLEYFPVRKNNVHSFSERMMEAADTLLKKENKKKEKNCHHTNFSQWVCESLSLIHPSSIIIYPPHRAPNQPAPVEMSHLNRVLLDFHSCSFLRKIK